MAIHQYADGPRERYHEDDKWWDFPILFALFLAEIVFIAGVVWVALRWGPLVAVGIIGVIVAFFVLLAYKETGSIRDE